MKRVYKDKQASAHWSATKNNYTCRVQNPDIPRAGRVGAHGGVAGRGRAGLDANRTVALLRTLQSIKDTSLERRPRSKNKRNPM